MELTWGLEDNFMCACMCLYICVCVLCVYERESESERERERENMCMCGLQQSRGGWRITFRNWSSLPLVWQSLSAMSALMPCVLA